LKRMIQGKCSIYSFRARDSVNVRVMVSLRFMVKVRVGKMIGR
jgi:hypothetical protein